MFSDYHGTSHTNPGKEGKEKNSSRVISIRKFKLMLAAEFTEICSENVSIG